MNIAPQNFTPAEILNIARTNWRLWLIPAVAGAFLAAAYSLIAPRTWSSTQTLIVRPEAASVSVGERLGKFSDLSEMKTLQETILELARSHSVIKSTLESVGPPASYSKPELWPTPSDVEDFRKHVRITPPSGAEFGKTEVFYLSVFDSDRNRATQLVGVLCDQLENRMQEVRDERAQSMIAELQKTVAMAQNDLHGEIVHLTKFEASVGADLSELRNLVTDIGAASSISQELQTIDTEHRAVASRIRENQKLLSVLRSAAARPGGAITTPQSLLKSQPAVHRLKDALVDAQVHTASLLATLKEDHPFVIGAREAESKIGEDLHNELDLAIQGIELDLSVDTDRANALSEQSNAGRAKLSELAEKRSAYANLVASVQNYTRLVEAARENLADARAHQAGAHSASLISRIDGVEAGVRPEGPSRKVVTAAGGLAGLLLGFGIVFLNVPAVPFGNNRESVVNDSIHSNDDYSWKSEAEVLDDPIRSAFPSVYARNGQSSTLRAAKPLRTFRGMTLSEAIDSIHNSRC